VRRADIQAVSRASQILGLFDVDKTELVTAEVAEALGLNRTTTHRYLTSMAAVGLLGHGTRHSSYIVGPLATRLGAIAAGATPALAVAPGHMQELSDEVAATVTLTLRATSGPMVIHVAEPRTTDAVLTVKVGTVLSAVSAQAAVYAAFATGADGAPFAAYRARMSPADVAVFEAQVARVHEEGFCIRRDPAMGFIVVAAPIFDATGLSAACATVSLASAAAEAAAPERAQRLRRMAAHISAELGGAAPH
jgi:DNA-binding IclR family transcriptional regulator